MDVAWSENRIAEDGTQTDKFLQGVYPANIGKAGKRVGW